MKKLTNLLKHMILIMSFLFISVWAVAQNVTLKVDKQPLSKVLTEITQSAGYKFVYSSAVQSKLNAVVSIECSNRPIAKVLDELFKGKGISYKVEGKNIALAPDEIVEKPQSGKKSLIRGKVTDDKGVPVAGADVLNRNTQRMELSDADGNYAIEASEGDVLAFTFLGMQPHSATVGKSSVLNVDMLTDYIALDDVVITGYQTISKERSTGSYSKVSAEVLQQKPTANISSSLVGLVPGLAVQNSSVDGTTRFIIRGQGTLQSDQADRDPLIVVDGFPINGFNTGDGSGLSTVKDPFSTINPNDVESVTVLKDAAATSIYGARAANGVIVITTKKGKEGTKLEIAVDAYYSVAQKADLDYYFNMASGENQFRLLENMQKYEPINITGASDPYMNPSARVGYWNEAYALLYERDSRGSITDEEYNQQKNTLLGYAKNQLWKKDINKYILRNTQKQQYNVSLRGASDKINYSFSASYDGEDSYIKGNDNSRILLNMASTAKITKNLSFSVNINTVFANKDDNGTSLATLKSVTAPWTRFTDGNGIFLHIPTSGTVYYPILMSEYEGKTPASWLYNPIEDGQYRQNNSSNMNYRVQGGFDYKTTWGLHLSAKGQYEYRRYDTHTGYDVESFYVRNLYNTYSTLNPVTGNYESYFPAGGVFTDSGEKYKGYNLRGQADYSHKFGKHDVTVLAGSEIISSTTDNVPSITRYGFNRNTYSVLATPDYATRTPNIFGVSSLMPYSPLGSLASYEERYFSVYANAGYSYDDRYSITASFRTDATNYQAEEVRDKFSPFWSVGAGWIISNEKFMNSATWVNQLKLRASIGVAGVSAGKRGNSSVTTLRVYPGDITYTNNESYSTIAMRGNPTLTWEKARTWNIGLDFGLFNNVFYGSVDYYNKYSYDVLAKATVPVVSQGTTTSTFNNAEIQNNGIEVSLGTNLRIADDFFWNGNLNVAYNNNKVTKYNVTSSSPTFNLDFLEGYALNSIAVLKPKGYTEDGFIILEGKDGVDEIITDMDTAHSMDQIDRQEGKTLDDLNYTYYLGSYTPKWEMGFSNRFTFKGITLSFMITGRFDYYVYRGDQYGGARLNEANFTKQLDNSFKVYDQGYANQKGYSAFPLYNDRNEAGFKASNCYMYMGNSQIMFDTNFERGDHIRLQEIYLGYDLPKRLLSKQKVFSGVNIYAQASNLGIIWSSCKDFDPEYPLGGIKPMTTFTFGVKLNFLRN